MHSTTEHFTKQSQKILEVLRAANGAWVPLPEILSLGIAQYNARVYELRRRGFDIQNKTEIVDGVKHSAYRLIEGDQFRLAPEGESLPMRERRCTSPDWCRDNHGRAES